MKNRLVQTAAYLAALILLQTLYYKFGAHPDSVYIFTRLGLEPYGRIGLGTIELLTAVLLVIPGTRGIGAIIGLGIITGALISHIFVLGIEVRGDGGKLFMLACLTWICCFTVAYSYRLNILQTINHIGYARKSH